MLRKISLVIAGTMLLSGVAAAAPFAIQATPTIPPSLSESGPNYAGPTTTFPGSVARVTGKFQEVQTPSSSSESMPEMTGGQSHPTMGTGATRATRPGRDLSWPSSSNETMPEMTGGQSHPTMGR